MRNSKRLGTKFVVAVATLALTIGTAALAQAIVQKDFFTGGPVFTPLGAGTITNSNYVQPPSGGFRITVHGTLNDLANAPDRAQVYTHETLGTFCFAPGDEFRLVVTPSGQINLTCRGD